ncbi:unnamed protein product [Ectocarpus sp. 12 AP-2014]
MKEFVATTNKLAAWAKGGKRRASSCHHADLSALIDYEEGLRSISNDIASVDGLEHHHLLLAMLRHLCPPTLPDMAAVPQGAISLTDAHVARPSLLGRAIGYLTNTALGDAPCDQIHEWLERLVLRVASTSGTAPPVLGSVEKAARFQKAACADAAKYAEAEPLFERTQAIREKLLGPGHVGVAATLNTRAGLCSRQAKYAEADTLYERAAEIWEQALGSDHPTVATVLHDRAEVLRMQGKYAEAEPLYERATEIWEKALGPGHPNVGTVLRNRASLLTTQVRCEHTSR